MNENKIIVCTKQALQGLLLPKSKNIPMNKHLQSAQRAMVHTINT